MPYPNIYTTLVSSKFRMDPSSKLANDLEALDHILVDNQKIQLQVDHCKLLATIRSPARVLNFSFVASLPQMGSVWVLG